MNAIDIYTDGACKGNPGPGGWGALLQSTASQKELFGGELLTTNNRMEMTAVIEALSALKRPCHVTLHVDSQYVLKGMTEWLAGWKAKGWKTAAKQPVKNVDLWQSSISWSVQPATKLTGAGSRAMTATPVMNVLMNWPIEELSRFVARHCERNEAISSNDRPLASQC